MSSVNLKANTKAVKAASQRDNKLQKLFQTVSDAVELAERTHGDGRGSAKRELAVTLINAVIDIPVLPERLEGWIYGMLVDFLVHTYNRMFGHRWQGKVSG